MPRGLYGATSSSDRVTIKLAKGPVRNLSTGKELQTKPLPGFIFDIIKAGGAVPYYIERIRLQINHSA